MNLLDWCTVITGSTLLLLRWHTIRSCLSQWRSEVALTYCFQIMALAFGCLVDTFYIATTPLNGTYYLLLFFALPADALQHVYCKHFTIFRPTLEGVLIDLTLPTALALINSPSNAAAFRLLSICIFINYACLGLVGTIFSKLVKSQEFQSKATSFLDKLRGVVCTSPLSHTNKTIITISIFIPVLLWAHDNDSKAEDPSRLLLLVAVIRLAFQLLLRYPAIVPSYASSKQGAKVYRPSAQPPAQRESFCKCVSVAACPEIVSTKPMRSLEELCDLFTDSKKSLKSVSNEEMLLLLKKGKMASYRLETLLDDPMRAVFLRRQWLGGICSRNSSIHDVPFANYDYASVSNRCCENVVGYVPVPLGFAGPLKVDDQIVYVPLCTTEGCLVASVNRGCQALMLSNGVRTALLGDSMTRGPVVSFEDLNQARDLKDWLEDGCNFSTLADAFNATSRYARLKSVRAAVVGRFVFLRFGASTGDAMGMNMLSKGVEAVLHKLQLDHFPNMSVLSLSGNYCVDKKPSAINWILGRGKSVTSEAVLPGDVVRKILKTNVDSLVELNTVKNLIGSAKAGVIGGFNAHSANVVAAIFASTGQDLAQIVGSCQCITYLEKTKEGDLRVSCTMPCLEVGTIGGGTGLLAQQACLNIMGCAGSNVDEPGKNAQRLSRIVCCTVMAGELSLLAALNCNQLVVSHLRYNRGNAEQLNTSTMSEEDDCCLVDQLEDFASRCVKQNGIHPPSCSTVFM